ncbi:uncharacterized protein [Clytia hemisphaerica]|uniref:C2H2-type domain-containing protein n=1 Tax=Clytia hemisphaerica TaxID=252671 RepID=A0A7M5VAR8_9CNID
MSESFNYQVILKPKDVKFTSTEIPSRFDNGTSLRELLEDLKSGKILSKDIPAAEVIWDCDRWEWYTLSNRRLWVFRELEKCGKITFIGMSRVESVDKAIEKTPELYSDAQLYDPDWDITIDSTKPPMKNKVMAIDVSSLPMVGEQDAEPDDRARRSDKTNEKDSDGRKEKRSMKRSRSEQSNVGGNEDEEWIEKVVEKKRISHYSSSQSLSSNTSCSSLARSDRVIDKTSGLHGYGNYHLYKTEYLDKIKAERKAILKKFKPYNVESSSRGSISRSSSFGKLIGSSRSYSSSSVYTEEQVTIKRERRSSVSSNTSETGYIEKGTRRLRLYSDDIESSHTSKESSRDLVPYRDRSSSMDCVVSSGIKLLDLYAMWQKRRIEYLRSCRYAIKDSSPDPFICGLCYKQFRTIVDLQQHCEALLHYACITCGKFFTSYASLGQHAQRLRHQKD